MHKYEIQRVCAQIRNAKNVDGSAGQNAVLFFGGWGESVYLYLWHKIQNCTIWIIINGTKLCREMLCIIVFAQLLLNLLFLNFKLKPFLWHFYGIFESDEYFKEIRHFFAVWIKEKGNAAIVKNVCTILDFQVMLWQGRLWTRRACLGDGQYPGDP